ncbi:MAG: LacI family DNA-binding transcriptional regulator [Bacteroidota bacterium]
MSTIKRATIYDIAAVLNKTPATVSRALNNNSRISEKTKKLVADMAKKMNYQPNTVAYNLRTGGSKSIGIIVPDITINFFAKVIAGIEEVASEKKYTTIICQSKEQLATEEEAVSALINQHVACIMISIATGTAQGNYSEHLKKAISHNIKVVQFDRTFDGLKTDRVINEVEKVTEKIIEHFVDQGYKNIAFLAGPQDLDIFRNRKAAFEKCIQKFKLPNPKQNIATYELTRESARTAARKLLSQKKRPDAILASTDMGALGVWDVAKEMELHIPNQIAMCGFSNDFYTQLVSPNISSVNQMSLEMGRAAANIFFDSLNDANQKTKKPRTVILESEVIVRASTLRHP